MSFPDCPGEKKFNRRYLSRYIIHYRKTFTPLPRRCAVWVRLNYILYRTDVEWNWNTINRGKYGLSFNVNVDFI